MDRSRVDKILDVIDVGIQRAGDVAYDWDTGACLRCGYREPAEGSAWCAPCRPGQPTAEQIQAVIAAFPPIAEAFQAMFDHITEFMRTAGPLLAEVAAAIGEDESPEPTNSGPTA